jgi:hypothetical protein
MQPDRNPGATRERPRKKDNVQRGDGIPAPDWGCSGTYLKKQEIPL